MAQAVTVKSYRRPRQARLNHGCLSLRALLCEFVVYGILGRGADKKRTNSRGWTEAVLKMKRFLQQIEGLQNLYAPVRFRPAPPAYSCSAPVHTMDTRGLLIARLFQFFSAIDT